MAKFQTKRTLTPRFSANLAKKCYEISGDYYLSIGDEKSSIWCFFEKNNIFGGKMGVKRSWASRPDQKLGPPSDTFGSTVISGNVFLNLGPETNALFSD